jgi:hypothetical protein
MQEASIGFQTASASTALASAFISADRLLPKPGIVPGQSTREAHGKSRGVDIGQNHSCYLEDSRKFARNLAMKSRSGTPTASQSKRS